MAELKTRATGASVKDFLAGIEDDQRRKDCAAISKLMQEITKAKPKMWGTAIVGFGSYHYTNSTRQQYEWFRCGFSPRKQALTLYLMGGYPKSGELMDKLGRHSTGGSCLYVKRRDDVHLPTLKKLIVQSLKRLETAGRKG